MIFEDMKNKTQILLSRSRKGVSFVEAIIVMIVLGISIWAIINSAVWASRLESSTREDLGAFLFAANWFEYVEAEDFEEGDDVDGILRAVAERWFPNPDHDRIGRYDYIVQGHRIKFSPSWGDGFLLLEMEMPTETRGKSPLKFVRSFNFISNETVSNNIIDSPES